MTKTALEKKKEEERLAAEKEAQEAEEKARVCTCSIRLRAGIYMLFVHVNMQCSIPIEWKRGQGVIIVFMGHEPEVQCSKSAGIWVNKN
jgi:hypothetical protein